MLPYYGAVRLTSTYGMRDDPFTGQRAQHNGVDLVGADKRIRAVKGGTVARSRIVTDKSNATSQWGEYIAITSDDGLTRYYCHLSQRLVAAGQTVQAGQQIGVEGATGPAGTVVGTPPETDALKRIWIDPNGEADISDGKSAYEIAVDNGFVGTEVQWLASLKGDTGSTGSPGSPGTPGSPGANGADGTNALAYYGTSSTASGTAAKASTITGFAAAQLVNGAVVGVKFTNANTSTTATLNISSTGAKSIRANGVAPLSGQIAAGMLALFQYDGTYWNHLNPVPSEKLNLSGGTMTGNLVSNNPAVATSAVRNIYAGTSDMTPGTTALATGALYLVYE